MSQTFAVCIYQDAVVANEADGIAFHVPRNPKLTRIGRGINFEALKQQVHRTLKLQPNQEVSEIIYRMPFGSNPVKYFFAEVTDDDGVDAMLDCHAQYIGLLPVPMI